MTDWSPLWNPLKQVFKCKWIRFQKRKRTARCASAKDEPIDSLPILRTLTWNNHCYEVQSTALSNRYVVQLYVTTPNDLVCAKIERLEGRAMLWQHPKRQRSNVIPLTHVRGEFDLFWALENLIWNLIWNKVPLRALYPNGGRNWNLALNFKIFSLESKHLSNDCPNQISRSIQRWAAMRTHRSQRAITAWTVPSVSKAWRAVRNNPQ